MATPLRTQPHSRVAGEVGASMKEEDRRSKTAALSATTNSPGHPSINWHRTQDRTGGSYISQLQAVYNERKKSESVNGPTAGNEDLTKIELATEKRTGGLELAATGTMSLHQQTHAQMSPFCPFIGAGRTNRVPIIYVPNRHGGEK